MPAFSAASSSNRRMPNSRDGTSNGNVARGEWDVAGLDKARSGRRDDTQRVGAVQIDARGMRDDGLHQREIRRAGIDPFVRHLGRRFPDAQVDARMRALPFGDGGRQRFPPAPPAAPPAERCQS
jgi:hypothetical protein